MRKSILLIISIVFATITFAQTSEALKTGTIVGLTNTELQTSGTVAAGAFGGPAASSAVSSRYMVQDNSTGVVYESVPFLSDLPVGAQVDFALTVGNRGRGEYPNANQMNMQKARHDAMMATIQNIR